MTTVIDTDWRNTATDNHQCAQGFCTVCGSTWPCWRAQRPLPRRFHVGRLDEVSVRDVSASPVLPRC